MDVKVALTTVFSYHDDECFCYLDDEKPRSEYVICCLDDECFNYLDEEQPRGEDVKVTLTMSDSVTLTMNSPVVRLSSSP